MIIKLIVKLKDIPVGATVTKPNGKTYLVQDKLIMEACCCEPKHNIRPPKDHLFLIEKNRVHMKHKNTQIAVEIAMSQEELLRRLNYEKNESVLKKSYKVVVTPEMSEILQKAYFKIGGEWAAGEKKAQLTDKPFLIFHKGKISHASTLKTFKINMSKEITFSKLLEKIQNG